MANIKNLRVTNDWDDNTSQVLTGVTTLLSSASTHYEIASAKSIIDLIDSGSGNLWEKYQGGVLTGSYASYDGIPPGCTTNVVITADNIGVDGNNIQIKDNAGTDLSSCINDWNILNPTNTASLTSGDGTQVLAGHTTITLSGGIDDIILPPSTGVQIKDGSNIAPGDYSLAGGSGSTSGSENSIAFGTSNIDINSNYSANFGENNNIENSPNSYITGINNNIDTDGGSSNNIYGSYNSTIYGDYVSGKGNNAYNSIIGGKNNEINRIDYHIIYNSTLIGGNENLLEVDGKDIITSGIFNGENNTIFGDSYNSGIICGSNNIISSGLTENSVIIGGHDLTNTVSNTVMVPALVLADTTTLSSPFAGTIYFDGTHFQGYNGSVWVQLDN